MGKRISITFTDEQVEVIEKIAERRDLVETYEKAKFKGVAYVKGRVTDS